MTFRKAAIACLLATTLVGAKPAPPPTTSSPQIAYAKISGGARRHYDLFVANEDGTGAALLYSTNDVGQMIPHMGPANDKTIVLVQGGRVSLLRYQTSTTGTKFQSLEPLFTINTATGGQHVDFSPNGKDIVWWHREIGTMKVFNLDTRTSSPVVQLAGEPHHFSFNRNGSAILFLDHVTDTDAILKQVPVTGGTPSDVGLRGDFWGIEPAHNSDALVLTRHVDVRTAQLEYYSNPAAAPTTLAGGYVPSFKCDGTVVIYQKYNPDNTVSILRVEPATLSTFTNSTSANYWPDYTGC